MTDMQMLEQKLIRLRLSGMAKQLSIRIHEAESSELTYQTFLDSLVTEEINRRTSNLYSRRLKLAGLPMLKTIDTFDFAFNTSVKKREIMDLMTCRCLIEKRNVLFLGPPGVGKTHLAIALGINAIENGYEVIYRSIFDFIEEFSLAIAEGKRKTFLKKMTCIPLLILDEFGMKKIPSDFSEDLLELFHRRCGTQSTVICTNRPVEDWGKIIGDVPATGAILDRFLERVYLFKISGRSYRLQSEMGSIEEIEDKEKKII